MSKDELTNWAIVPDEECWRSREKYATKEEALRAYQEYLKWLSELHPITKPDEIYSNPGLDEYVSIWRE